MTLWLTVLLAGALSTSLAYIADAYLDERIAVLGSFAGLQLAHNPGIAFSITLPNGLETVLILIALGLITWLAVRTAKTRTQHIAFGLIIGGALGNVIDRFPDGVVTDFFQVGTFPIFNVADSCITIGVLLLLLLELLHFVRRT